MNSTTNQITDRNVLIVDHWENMIGELVAGVLKQKRTDSIRLVVGGDKGLEESKTEPPDAIFIYLWTGNPDALEFCQQIRLMPETKHIAVIVWGAMAPESICSRLWHAGATGYLHLPCSSADILAAYDAAIKGEKFYPATYRFQNDAQSEARE